MEILDRKKTDIYGDDIYLYFTMPIPDIKVESLIGDVSLIGETKDGGWHIKAENWSKELISFGVMGGFGYFSITFDDLGDYEIKK